MPGISKVCLAGEKKTSTTSLLLMFRLNMHYEIKNIAGLEVIFAELPGSYTTTLQVLTKAGSIYESEEKNGISHFLEHMFFKGGKTYTSAKAVAETIDAFGGEFNAFTANEYAGYYVKCARENVSTALDVLADMMLHATFPKDEMEREKQVVLQEMSMYEDSPRSLVYKRRSTRYFGETPFGRPVLGTPQTVMAISQESLHEHKHSLYTKDNLILIVAGNIENTHEIEQQIGELFAELPEKCLVSAPVLGVYKPKEHQSSYVKETQQNHLIMVADAYSMHDEYRYAASIVSTLLGGPMSSRLFSEIREKEGLCYYISASNFTNNQHGYYFIRAGMDKERRDHGLARIYQEVEKVASGDISQKEIDMALGNILGSMKMEIESSSDLASRVGFQHLFKEKILSVEDSIKAYTQVTRNQIQEAAGKLAKENLYAFRIE